MSLIVLSDTERNRFGDWLLQEARTADGLAEQMEKLGKIQMETIGRKLKVEAAAHRIVEARLRGGEQIVVGVSSEPTRE